MNIEITTDYTQRFYRGLYTFLSKFISDKNVVLSLLGPTVFPTWIRAFTHQTVDPIDNYESIELLGDRVLEMVFTRYMLLRFPTMTPGMLTPLKSYYMSKKKQGEFAKKIGFDKFARIQSTESNIHIDEDLFESFFGALFDISDSIVGLGSGYLHSMALIQWIFDPIEIDLGSLFTKNKTIIRQNYFEPLGWGDIKEEYIKLEDGRFSLDLSMTRNGTNYLKVRGIQLPQILGHATGTKDLATDVAYQKVFNLFNSKGMTIEWATQEKEQRDFNNPALADVVGPAEQKMRRDGYDRLKFSAPRTTSTVAGTVLQLIGVNTNPAREIILATTTINEKQWLDGKRALLDQYSRS